MKNVFRGLALGALLVIAGGMSACTQLSSFAIDTATELSSATPNQATTFEGATLIADAGTKTIGWLADNASTLHINLASLTQLNAINDTIHVAWLKLKASHDAGTSLDFAAFDAALTAYNTYKAETALPDAPASVVPPVTASMLSAPHDQRLALLGFELEQLYAGDFGKSSGALKMRGVQIAIR